MYRTNSIAIAKHGVPCEWRLDKGSESRLLYVGTEARTGGDSALAINRRRYILLEPTFPSRLVAH